MISVAEALAKVLAGARRRGSELVPLEEALERHLSEDVDATWDLPAYDNSAMDGYAVRAADVAGARGDSPTQLRVVDRVYAGDAAKTVVKQGQAVRITTGARIPPGADAVVRQEATNRSGDDLAVRVAVEPGANIRRRGEDAGTGTTVLSAGSRVGATEAAVLAAFGYAEVSVVERPCLSIVPTGDEIRSVQSAVADVVVDTNTPMIFALARGLGALVERFPVVADEPAALRERLQAAAEGADVVVTTGGASVGDRDHVHDVLVELGADIVFWKAAIKPGKAVGHARLGDVLVFALPGNPAACRMTFDRFVAPTLRVIQGAPPEPDPWVPVVLDDAVQKQPGLDYFLRCRAVLRPDGIHVTLPQRRGSGQLTPSVGANAVARIPAGRGSYEVGDVVAAQIVGPLQGAPSPAVLAFVGMSNTGKTTLLEALIERLVADGLRVAACKHDAHGFDIDHEGKDSRRFRQAGASSVAIASPQLRATISETPRPLTKAELVATVAADVDLVLVEGFKSAPGPKVEVHRKGKPLLVRDGEITDVIAIVSDDPDVPSRIPRFAHDAIDELVVFVRTHIGK